MIIITGLALGAVCLLGAVLFYYARHLPDYQKITQYQPPPNQSFVLAKDVPLELIHAFLAAEDRDFYQHSGIDIPAILHAILFDALHFDQRPIGASTITQQVVRMFLLSNERTLDRKLKEILLALQIERVLPKDRILELYLNDVYLGCRSRGVVMAARSYFGRSLAELTLPEAAFLAGLPKAPGHYQPSRFPTAAKNRRDWVIDRMVEDGYITPGLGNVAKAESLTAAARAAAAKCQNE